MREEGGRFGRVQTVSVLQVGVFADQQEEEKHENAEDAEAGLGSGNGWGDARGRRMATDARRDRRRVYGAVGRPIG